MSQTIQPTFVAPIDETSFKLHIAVDFGTDGIGLAYAIDNDVFVHQKWNSMKYGATVKPKTIILLDDEEGITFGMDAKFTYMNLTSNKKNKWMLFERFKMSLYEDKITNNNKKSPKNDNDDEKNEDDIQFDKIEINEELAAANGLKYSSEKIFIAAFKHIEKESSKFLRKKKIRLKKSDIQWIVTVPAIWSDKSKNKMKEWVIKSGLVDTNIKNQCKIVYEPDCASLAIQYEVKNKSFTKNDSNITDDAQNDEKEGISKLTDDAEDISIHNDANNDKIFVKGEKYVLVDAGGGTVDIACHEILGEFGVKEIHHPSGGPWGSCYIDDQYIKLLEQIFTEKWINEFKTQSPNSFVEIIHSFQEVKATFYNNPEAKKHNCRLPDEFMSFLDEKVNEHQDDDHADIEDIVVNAVILGKSNMVSLHDEFLEINQAVWIKMFDYVIDPTTEHITKLLNEANVMRNCKYLCLVGGLSCSPYFQCKMKEIFGPISKYKLQIIIPKRPILTVVQGAAYFGITTDYIKARRIAKTYGIHVRRTMPEAVASGIPEDFIENNKYEDTYDNQCWVSNCFDAVVRKGEEIWTHQTIIREYCRPGNDIKMCLEIVCSDLNDPLMATNNDVIATSTMCFNSIDEANAKIVVEWHFYDTTLKLVYYLEKRANEKKEMQIQFDII